MAPRATTAREAHHEWRLAMSSSSPREADAASSLRAIADLFILMGVRPLALTKRARIEALSAAQTALSLIQSDIAAQLAALGGTTAS
jgi:hypothetical protein